MGLAEFVSKPKRMERRHTPWQLVPVRMNRSSENVLEEFEVGCAHPAQRIGVAVKEGIVTLTGGLIPI